MRASKDALRTARKMLEISMVDGKLDADRVKQVTSKVIEGKPRGYLGILTAFEHLVRLELGKRHATVESAVEIPGDLQASVMADLRKKYGKDLSFEFKSNPELLGGMRVKVGSDVWDGSVRARLQQLSEAFN